MSKRLFQNKAADQEGVGSWWQAADGSAADAGGIGKGPAGVWRHEAAASIRRRSETASKPRVVFLLQVTLGALGAAATILAFVVGLRRVTWGLPSGASLLEACQRFVPETSAGSLAVLALGGLSFAVVALTLRSGLRRVQGSRAVVRALRVVEARRIGASEVRVFEHQAALAFCAGLLRPRIYLSTATLSALSGDELDAVIAHEQHHVRQRDPLRFVIAGVLADGLFFAPALRQIADRYAALAELAADRAAVRVLRGDAAPLASALLAFERADPAVVGIAPERVDHLLGETPRWELPCALLAWTLVLIGGIVAIALRLQTAAEDPVNLPLMATQLCMVAMAVVPLAVVGGSLLGARGLRRRRW